METISEFISTFVQVIINPIIRLLFAGALIYFLWGVLKYIQNAGNPDKRKEGLEHIIWGIVGLVIMVSVFGIIRVMTSFLG